MSLTEFLLARIAEDEADAKFAGDGGREVEWRAEERGEHDAVWRVMAVCGGWPLAPDVDGTGDWRFNVAHAQHIGRHDPARVLAECEAKRQIVDLHHEYLGVCTHCVQVGAEHDRESWPCPTLRALAAVHADHPDYDRAWAVRA